MPQDLPGFYFDPERNRYFPVKGPIPGSNPNSSASHIQGSSSKPKRTNDRSTQMRKRRKAADLLQLRELYGKIITCRKWKSNFQHEYQNLQASLPVVWKYQSTDCIADGALEQVYIDSQTLQGEKESNVLLVGGKNGSLSLYEVGKIGQHFDYGVKCMPNHVWPLITEYEAEGSKTPQCIQTSRGASVHLPSAISCIKSIPDRTGDGSSSQHALATTLGSGLSGGSIYTLNISEALDLRMTEIGSLHCTIWTADCNSMGTLAAIGTDLGAALINLETGLLSWVCRSKSDILSQQFDQSGNVVLCGFRNGAIAAIDVRQKPNSLSPGLPRHKLTCSSNKVHETPRKRGHSLTKQSFELKGNLSRSGVIFMSSAVCSLVTLQSDDQYFLASSMDGFVNMYVLRSVDKGPVSKQVYIIKCNSYYQLPPGENRLGWDRKPLKLSAALVFLPRYVFIKYCLQTSAGVRCVTPENWNPRLRSLCPTDTVLRKIKLYDLRLLQRGAIQSYEGHVNSHTPVQLGVDQSELFVMSGGEDCCLRTWSIKTGELIFETDPLDSIVSTVCWIGSGKFQEQIEKRRKYDRSLYEQNHSWEAWLGSHKGLFYIHGP